MGIFSFLEDTEYGYKDMGEIGHIYRLFTDNRESSLVDEIAQVVYDVLALPDYPVLWERM